MEFIDKYQSNFIELFGCLGIEIKDRIILARFTGKFVTDIVIEKTDKIKIYIENDFIYLEFDKLSRKIGPFRDRAYNNINIHVRYLNNYDISDEFNLEILNIDGMELKTKIKR